jgi:hypothetical protein
VTFEAFAYAVIMSSLLQLLMEATCWIVVEVVTNVALSTTMSMVALGCYFLFPGYGMAL